MKKFEIKFSPDGKTVQAHSGQTIMEAAQAGGIDINNACGGDGVCGKCRVIVKKGDVEASSTIFLTRRDVQKGYVLACLAKVASDLEVEIPPESR
ncbi:MAG: 2Fe-2S iron-sulfur cluster binding domain-containing protein, partial [Candidatus Omnitrophica bacterium]|nr:2Fe-2S iron-sulfur cluster binding domain-containing protein [Candidatus Omnitrophota bacterium]